MKNIRFIILILGALLFLNVFSLGVFSQCTNVVCGKDATVDGSVMVLRNSDTMDTDFRLVYVPAKDHKLGDMRPVYQKYPLNYPRYVMRGRAWAYEPVNGQVPYEPIGFIPQVEHTFAIWETSQGLRNEHQLGIGEATCRSKPGKGISLPEGAALFSNSIVNRIAMERCRTAREAVQLMGDLCVEYGYYANAEALIVIDPNEAWIFNVMPDDTEKSAVWAAQRVPDDECAAVANQLTIGEIDLNNPDYFMASDNVYEVAERQGWWKPGEVFSFKRVYTEGESSKYSSARRHWRFYDLVAPSLKLSPWVKDAYNDEYPFSIKPDKKISVQDLLQMSRDVLEGTEFDLTKGPAAGPYGSPYRYGGTMKGDEKVKGKWERSLSTISNNYSVVHVARSWLPDEIGGVSWFGASKNKITTFVPFYCGINDLPKCYQTGHMLEFNRNSAWWAFTFVTDLVDKQWSVRFGEVKELQEKLENKQFALQPAIESVALELYKVDPELAREFLTDYCQNNANNVVDAYWELADKLIVKYRNNRLNTFNEEIGRGKSTSIGYPAWWLKSVGYEKGVGDYTE